MYACGVYCPRNPSCDVVQQAEARRASLNWNSRAADGEGSGMGVVTVRPSVVMYGVEEKTSLDRRHISIPRCLLGKTRKPFESSHLVRTM